MLNARRILKTQPFKGNWVYYSKLEETWYLVTGHQLRELDKLLVSHPPCEAMVLWRGRGREIPAKAVRAGLRK